MALHGNVGLSSADNEDRNIIPEILADNDALAKIRRHQIQITAKYDFNVWEC